MTTLITAARSRFQTFGPIRLRTLGRSTIRLQTVSIDGFIDVGAATQNNHMSRLKHPMNGAMYTVLDNGHVQVENNGLTGTFTWDGQHCDGELTYADPHMLVWLAGPQLPDHVETTRKHRG